MPLLLELSYAWLWPQFGTHHLHLLLSQNFHQQFLHSHLIGTTGHHPSYRLFHTPLEFHPERSFIWILNTGQMAMIKPCHLPRRYFHMFENRSEYKRFGTPRCKETIFLAILARENPKSSMSLMCKWAFVGVMNHSLAVEAVFLWWARILRLHRNPRTSSVLRILLTYQMSSQLYWCFLSFVHGLNLVYQGKLFYPLLLRISLIHFFCRVNVVYSFMSGALAFPRKMSRLSTSCTPNISSASRHYTPGLPSLQSFF